jgi:hypothetical protein
VSPAFVDNDGQLNWRKIAYHARSAFAVVLALFILIGGGWFAFHKVDELWTSMRAENDYVGQGRDEVIVVFPNESTITQIGDILVKNGVIKSTKTFRNVVAKNPEVSSINAGRYRLRTEVPAETALAMILDPANKVRLTVRIPEGEAKVQQWPRLVQELGLEQDDFPEAAASPDLGIPSWSQGGDNVEGFLFPDTYEVAEPADAKEVLQQQVAQFNKVSTSVNLESRAAQLGKTPYEVLIIASMVEKEAARPEDRAKVAGVVYNRLRQDMPLGFDSTVHYAINDFTRITTSPEDRAVDSPYNTYVNKGLPPTPIGNPGQAAIEAALAPESHDYLYFVTVDPDSKETRFAKTGEEHNQNVALFQQWCQSHPGKCAN